MKKNHGIWIASAIVVLSIATFFIYHDKKKGYVRTIKDYNASSQPLAWLLTLDEGYLKAWAAALKNGQSTFMYNDNGTVKKFNSQGGKTTA